MVKNILEALGLFVIAVPISIILALSICALFAFIQIGIEELYYHIKDKYFD